MKKSSGKIVDTLVIFYKYLPIKIINSIYLLNESIIKKMKKSLLFLATITLIYFASCNSKKEDVTETIPGMMDFTIKINGNPLSIMLPDSTKGRMEIIEQPWGATEIKVANIFQISIKEEAGDFSLTKGDITGNEVNKFKRYIKDEPNLLFWESEITEPEFHFYFIQKVGTTSYLIEDIKDLHFNEKAVQTMIDAAKTLKVKEAAQPNS
jgi:hypothetical protein